MLRSLIVKNSSIQRKLIISYFFLIIIPLGVLGLLTMNFSKQVIKQEVSDSNLKTLGQIAEKLEMVMDDIILLAHLTPGGV